MKVIKGINKKRGNCTRSLVPHHEALASPDSSRTSNAEAHADMYITINTQPYNDGCQYVNGMINISNGHLPLLCL